MKTKNGQKEVFDRNYKAIMLNTDLNGTTMRLYGVLRALASLDTHQVIIYVKTLAEKINRTPSTVHRCLNTLIELGFVERIAQKSEHDGRMNLANLFIVHDIDVKDDAVSKEI